LIVQNLMILSDLERLNGRHYVLFNTIWQISGLTASNSLQPTTRM